MILRTYESVGINPVYGRRFSNLGMQDCHLRIQHFVHRKQTGSRGKPFLFFHQIEILKRLRMDMAAKKKSHEKAIKTLMTLPGVGKASAEKLAKAGMKTVGDVAKAGNKGLVSAGISAAAAKKILAGAASSAKDTAKKAVKKTTKSAAKKKAEVIKKAKSIATTTKATAKKAAKKVEEVAEATVEKTKGSMQVKSEKSKDGRKGSTLKVPRSVTDMPWYRNK